MKKIQKNLKLNKHLKKIPKEYRLVVIAIGCILVYAIADILADIILGAGICILAFVGYSYYKKNEKKRSRM